MSIASPLNLLGRLLVNLPDPENAHSCDKDIDEQAHLPVIAYDSKERRNLLAAIKRKEGSAVIEKLLTNNILTHQSIGRALENAVEMGSTDAAATLLTDSRLTKQSIGRALEKAAENHCFEIVPLLTDSLIERTLAKYNQEEELTSLEKKELQKDRLFMNTSLSKAKKIAVHHDHLEMVNHLDKTAKELRMSIFS